MTNIREQMPDFGRPLGPTACQESSEIGRRASFRRHGAGLRQVDATHPSIDPPGTKTQLSSNLGDRTASFVERSDLVKHRLAGGVAPAAQQTFVRRDIRATIGTFDHGLLPRVRIVFDLDGGCPDRRLETAELPLHGFLEVL
jgi:hypothetical protein